jgi:hypothetical protein
MLNKRKYPKYILAYLLEKYPNKNWNWIYLAYNPNITLDLIEKYPHKHWLFNEKGISSEFNKNFTIKWIEKYPKKDWCWGKFGISSNPNLSIKWIEKYPNKPWLFGQNGISNNLNIFKSISQTIEFIEKYQNKPLFWGYNGISKSSPFILELIEKYPNKPWFWGYGGISSNPNLTIEWIEKYPNKSWFWGDKGISSNPALTIEILEKYSDKEWDWDSISCNPNFKIEWIEKFPNKNWMYYSILNNPNICKSALMSLKFIEKHQDKIMHLGILYMTSNMLLKWFEEYPNKDWNFKYQNKIYTNPENLIEYLESNSISSCNYWSDISSNPNITLKLIEKYIDKINFNELSRNTFNYYNNKYIKKINEKVKLFYYFFYKKISYDIKRYIVNNYC